MTDKIKHSGIYERLVAGDHDFLGQVAYSIYKCRKREFIMRKQSELKVENVPDEIVADFVSSQSDYTLDIYRTQADSLSREFLDSSFGEEVAKLRREYQETLAGIVKQNSFWYGVLQGIVASFLFVMAGYVILKMSGSWDIILANLLK